MEELLASTSMNTMKMKKNLLRYENEKLDKAIALLNVLVRPETRSILEYLYEHREAAYIDLLVHSRQENIEPELRDMIRAGILQKRNVYYTMLYRINMRKLFRIRKAALSMTARPEEAAAFMEPVKIGANS